MKKTVLFLSLFILCFNILNAQKLTKKYNMILNRNEYYNQNNVMVMFSIEDHLNNEVLFFNSKGQMIDPKQYNIKQIKKEKKDLCQRNLIFPENTRCVYNSRGRLVGFKLIPIKDDFVPGP